MNRKTQFKVVLVKNIRKDGTYPIKIRYTENRKSYFQNTGFNVKEYEWHSAKSQVNSRHPEYQKINQEIELMMKRNMDEIIKKEEKTTADLKKIKPKSKEITIGEILNLRLENERSRAKVSTEKKLNTAMNHLKLSGISKLALSNFTVTQIKQFDTYLLVKKNISAYSRKCYHAVIRATLNEYCTENFIGYDSWNDPYRRFRGDKIGEVKKESLKGEDIHELTEYLIFNKKKSGRRFDAASMFLFSFYTCGLRFGDVFNLLWGNIGVDGILRVTAEKNYRKLVVKLNPKQANILKYFTPLNSLFQNNFSNRIEVENELMEKFPRISKLIDYEIKYIELREKTRPQKYELIQKQFEEFGIEPELVIEDEETKMELQEVYEIRDEILISFLISFAENNTQKPIFPFRELKEYKPRELVFKKETSNTIVNKELKNVFDDLGRPSVSFHVARHTFANLARLSADRVGDKNVKWDIYRISKALGHSSVKVTELYLRGFENVEITNAMDSFIDVMNEFYDV